jgi:hypothetical protein
MHDLEQAIARATIAGEEVHGLLQSVKLMVTCVETRLDAFVRNREADTEGALRSLADDVGRMYAVANELAGRASTVASAACERVSPTLAALARRPVIDPGSATWVDHAEKTLCIFAATQRTVCELKQRAASDVEALREAAFRHDAAPDVLRSADDLLLRLRKPR